MFRFVRADEKLAAFLELETAIRTASGWLHRLFRPINNHTNRCL
jgi:hypothetical protein